MMLVLGQIMGGASLSPFAPFGKVGGIPSNGLRPFYLVLLSTQCYADPDGVRSFWGILQIPNKWYPLFFVAFFSLLSGMPRPDLVCALVVGYFYGYGIWNLDRFLPSKSQLGKAEDLFWRCCCRRCCLSADGSGCEFAG